MGPTGEPFRILQLHPTLQCNLRCAHCYSLSGPEERGGVSSATLLAAIKDASTERYNIVSVSGGEPLVYPHLGELLDRAHACGMATMLVTNGILLDRRRLDELAGRADLIAISIDGVPASHDRIRRSIHAFERMASRLEGLRDVGIVFGFIFTLTRRNLHELEWVARFATEQGAQVLHVHPLEEVGRAETLLRGLEPDDVELAAAWVECERLRSVYGDRIAVHLDVIDVDAARSRPECVLASGPCHEWEVAPLGELLSPLVIEADGLVVPLNYGFARRYALGRLAETRLTELTDRWRATTYLDFLALCRRTLERLIATSDLPFVNWYGALARMAGHNEPGSDVAIVESPAGWPLGEQVSPA